ncbi:hypothetical protein EN829_003795 [Mesorhizobium sp. M00.F.Ca.ET.186.01.1.1]|nr:hypothetical protein EN829_003795 [Mesorhizobium sp. M00.F.Ca.ET.186.01.1.1]
MTVLTVDAVDFAVPVSGGNRGRLVEFAKIVEGKTTAIMFFADADYDLLLNKKPPGNVLLTDRRDIEGYIFNERAIGKILRLSLCTTEESKPLFNAIISICKRVAAIRVFSEERGLKLPFQDTNLKRYISKGTNPMLDEGAYIKALMQNGEISLS